MLDIDAILDIGAILNMGTILNMGEVEVICVEPSVVDIHFIIMSANVVDPPMSILLSIPVMLVGEASVGT